MDQILFFEPKIGSFRLPTHIRDSHMNFFEDSFLKIELLFRSKGTPIYVLLGVKGLNKNLCAIIRHSIQVILMSKLNLVGVLIIHCQ